MVGPIKQTSTHIKCFVIHCISLVITIIAVEDPFLQIARKKERKMGYILGIIPSSLLSDQVSGSFKQNRNHSMHYSRHRCTVTTMVLDL